MAIKEGPKCTVRTPKFCQFDNRNSLFAIAPARDTELLDQQENNARFVFPTHYYGVLLSRERAVSPRDARH